MLIKCHYVQIYLAVLQWKYLSCIFLLSIRHFSISIKALFLPKLISNDYLTAPRTRVAKMLKCCFDSRRQQILSRWVVLDKNGNAISHFYEDQLIWQSWKRNWIGKWNASHSINMFQFSNIQPLLFIACCSFAAMIFSIRIVHADYRVQWMWIYCPPTAIKADMLLQIS